MEERVVSIYHEPTHLLSLTSNISSTIFFHVLFGLTILLIAHGHTSSNHKWDGHLQAASGGSIIPSCYGSYGALEHVPLSTPKFMDKNMQVNNKQ